MSVEVISRIGTVAGTFLYGAPFYMSGKCVFVANDGSDANNGLTYKKPKLTTSAAVGAAADYGIDMVVFKSGFRETITSGLSLGNTKDGLILVSEGSGSGKATLTFGAGGYLAPDGDDQRIIGVNFAQNSGGNNNMVQVGLAGSAHTHFKDCGFTMGVAGYSGIVASDAEGVFIEGCTFTSAVAGAGPGVDMQGALDGFYMRDCIFDGGSTGWASDIACKLGVGGAVRGFLVDGCTLSNRSRINISTNCRGLVRFDSPDDIGTGSGVDWTY